MHSVQPSAPSAARDEQRALILRICASRHFSKAPRLREFLLHITDRSLENRAAEISEVEIAREVFERGDGFVPQEDSVVRSAARQLRLKLKDYFDDEGRGELWRVDVPKGSYVPVFSPRQASAEIAPPVQQTNWRRLLLASAGANLLLLLISGALVWRFMAGSSAIEPPRGSLVGTFLAGTDGAVAVVVSDFSLAAMRHLSSTNADQFGLDQYSRWDYGPMSPGAATSPEMAQIFDLLRGHHITRSGDLSIAVGIVKAAGPDQDINIRHARDVSARELRSSSHIILGNPYSTPWAEPYEEKLGFRWIQGKGYRDVHAGTGAPAEYVSTESSFNERGSGYGRLAWVPNLSGQGQVLLVSGINMVTMEATGEAALSSDTWFELRNRLGIREGSRVPAFEAILRTEALDNTPQHAGVVKVRLIR